MNESERPPNRGGRPRVTGEPTERLSTRVPVSTFDALTRIAARRDTSVASVVRQILAFRLTPPKK
jgi:hypothetical protein